MAKSTSEPEADQRGCDGDTAVYDLIEDTLHYATANKLPLSTTYVTFMVAMGSFFADQAWGRESAVYRITGVLSVLPLSSKGWYVPCFLINCRGPIRKKLTPCRS